MKTTPTIRKDKQELNNNKVLRITATKSYKNWYV